MRTHGLRAERRQQLVDDLLVLSAGPETYDTDELLSMGQSRLVASLGKDCDQSIFLSTPGLLNQEGTSLQALALYDVLKNDLGIEVAWPAPDQSIIRFYRSAEFDR